MDKDEWNTHTTKPKLQTRNPNKKQTHLAKPKFQTRNPRKVANDSYLMDGFIYPPKSVRGGDQ